MQVEQKKLILIGKGSNSDIYRYGDGQKSIILKVVSTSCIKESKHLDNQYKILNSLNHQNIIKVLKYKDQINLHGTGSNKQLLETCKNVLIMQNACHGTLLNFSKKIRPTPNQVRWIFAELCQAVRYLHCNYIVHRDLKPDNVLVSQNDSQIQIKLADFGYATSTRTSHLSHAYKGTKRGFMAPQISALKTNCQLQYDMYKTDIFALGVILFSLVTDRLPFEYATSQNWLYNLIQTQKYDDFWRVHKQQLQKYSQFEGSDIEGFKEIFIMMVQFDGKKRPNIQQVIQCSWMRGKQEIIKCIPYLNEHNFLSN